MGITKSYYNKSIILNCTNIYYLTKLKTKIFQNFLLTACRQYSNETKCKILNKFKIQKNIYYKYFYCILMISDMRNVDKVILQCNDTRYMLEVTDSAFSILYKKHFPTTTTSVLNLNRQGN